MFSKASIVAIIVATIVWWGLEGIWMGLLMGDYYATAYEAFKSVQRPMEQMNALAWLVNTFIAGTLLIWVARKGGVVTVKGTALTGAILWATFNFMMEYGMNQYFLNYPFIPTSLISTGWELVAGAITGAAAGWVYTKLHKA